VAFLELRHVAKSFGSTRVLDDLNLCIEQGECVCLLGPSGCGKSTTLNIIAGFIKPDGGEVLLRGVDQLSLPPHRRDNAMVFQNYALFPHLTVRQNVAFGLEVKKVPRDEASRRVAETLDLVQLGNLADRYPKQLSGGQQQRVALARAVIVRPSLLLLDEPLSNLDARLRRSMQDELRAIQRATGITTLFVTHDQEEALTIADRIAVLDAGRLMQIGCPQEIYQRPASLFVASFIGDVNVLPCRVASIAGGVAELEYAGRRLFCTNFSGISPNDRVNLLVRPEVIRLKAAPQGSDNVLPVTLVTSSYLGVGNRIVVRAQDRDLQLWSDPVASKDCLSCKEDLHALWGREEGWIVRHDGD
jgi:putative spermidine/putrescine transport system ATP-binding protein